MTTNRLFVPDSILARFADLRARGASFEAAAAKVGFPEGRLREVIDADYPRYRRLYARARREVADEVWAEALQFARIDFRAQDIKYRQRAYDIAARAVAADQRAARRRRPAKGDPDREGLSFLAGKSIEELRAISQLTEADLFPDLPAADDPDAGDPPPGGPADEGPDGGGGPPAPPGPGPAPGAAPVRPADQADRDPGDAEGPAGAETSPAGPAASGEEDAVTRGAS